MKAISIKQPWASLIAEGVKDIENRSWPTKFRGRVLIHASAKGVCKRANYHKILKTEQWESLGVVPSLNMISSNYNYDNGAIIGSVEIVDCVINHSSVWAEKTTQMSTENIYNWVLANPIKFPEPIPAKGKLSFWDYPNILAEPEEKDGALFCHCQLPIKEINQVTGDSGFGFYCRYCGGRWYK